jgi:hypothetical protein
MVPLDLTTPLIIPGYHRYKHFAKIISDQVEFKAVTIIVTAWGLRSFWALKRLAVTVFQILYQTYPVVYILMPQI